MAKLYSQTNVTQGNIDAYVIDDPNQLYLVKSTGTALGNSAVGSQFTIIYNAGSTINGLSGTYLNEASQSQSTGQLLVQSVSFAVDNIPATTNEDFVVKVKSSASIA